MMHTNTAPLSVQDLYALGAKAIAPRPATTVSQWADAHRVLSSKGSAEPGPWRTSRNGALREPMDCFSARSAVVDVTLMFPIQFGKTEVEVNSLGYLMTQAPGPIMVCLPSEVSAGKWLNQKLNPLIDETTAVRDALVSMASRDASNTRFFKDFAGGQLYLEHAGSPARLKSTSVRYLLVDELDEFAANFGAGDDPVDMLDGRTSAFPANSRRAYIGTPDTLGTSRVHAKFLAGDQRYRHVACPHCDEMQPLVREGFGWELSAATQRVTRAFYVCQSCGAEIDEHHKPEMLRDVADGGRARWVAHNPDAPVGVRSYTINCLYYPFGLGPRWATLAQMWVDAQGDPAREKTFINDRWAQPYADARMAEVKSDSLYSRGKATQVRTVPAHVLAITAGVDTQDNRLAVQIVGWGARMSSAVLDYVELPGDPAQAHVWDALTELLNTPLVHASGAPMRILATLQDMAGHRTEYVKDYSRQRRITRHMAGFGAIANTAPILGKPKFVDVTFAGKTDARGLATYQVGTVAAKQWLYTKISTDAQADPREATLHIPSELGKPFFEGMTSEVFNPKRNRFEKRRGAPRNEPLDTWVYAFAAAHHPELRLHRRSLAEWQAISDGLWLSVGKTPPGPVGELHMQDVADAIVLREQHRANTAAPVAAKAAAPTPAPTPTPTPTKPQAPRGPRVARSSYLGR